MAKIGKVQEVAVNELVPYEKNAKIHGADQIEKLKASIKEFGFLTPCLIDKKKNIIAGHGRVMAAKQLGLETVPCVFIEGLTEVQRRAYILADNKLGELAEWNRQMTFDELVDLSHLDFDVSITGFELEDVGSYILGEDDLDDDELERQRREFEEKMRNGELSEDSEEYQEFLKKFEPKKTTDDCYTPDNIYEGVADWVAKEYNLKRKDFVRPFYPGGDYKAENYDGKIVVDNPPFSILSEIEDWYNDHGVRYFLFCPSVSAFPGAYRCTAVCVGASITYDNGANVSTSFVTNMEDPDIVARTTPDLYAIVKTINDENIHQNSLPTYEYPRELVTASMMAYLSKYGQNFKFKKKDASKKIGELDSQKEAGKGIFGGGYLLSEKAAAEKAAAKVWQLSEREKEIIRSLGEV